MEKEFTKSNLFVGIAESVEIRMFYYLMEEKIKKLYFFA
jgi:hypothetical protein